MPFVRRSCRCGGLLTSLPSGGALQAMGENLAAKPGRRLALLAADGGEVVGAGALDALGTVADALLKWKETNCRAQIAEVNVRKRFRSKTKAGWGCRNR